MGIRRRKSVMKVGSLFSGGGLGDLGFVMAGCEIVFQVEIDEYSQKILELRYPDAKKFRDIRTVKGRDLPECDIITGGFPCQPFSVAGKQKGKDDNRHLWPEMFRIISEVRPTWVVGENVSGFVRIALDEALHDLESIGYEATTIVFPAHALGAPHRRERVWIVGYAEHNGRDGFQNSKSIGTRNRTQAGSQEPQQFERYGGGERRITDVADNNKPGLPKPTRRQFKRIQKPKKESTRSESCGRNAAKTGWDWWSTEPDVGRVAHGVPSRVDRLKCLGNGQVPFVTKWIAERIMEFEEKERKRGNDEITG